MYDQIFKLIGKDSVTLANIDIYGTKNALAVAIFDASGNQITSFGSGSSTFGSAFPSTGAAVGFTDGTSMRAATVFDVDSGSGTQYVQGVSLRGSASGGSVELGTTSNPLVVTTSGAAIQAVSGQYNSTNPTLTNSAFHALSLDVNSNLKTVEQYAPQAEDNTNNVIAMVVKPLAVSTYSPSLFKNLGANATLNVKASTGNILSIYARNVSGGDRWIQLHNTATTPTGGAVPVYSFYVPSGGVTERGTEFFTLSGVNGSNGWAFACSTTEGTYTAATATDHFTYIQYI